MVYGVTFGTRRNYSLPFLASVILPRSKCVCVFKSSLGRLSISRYLRVSFLIQKFDTVQEQSSDCAVVFSVLPRLQHQVAGHPVSEKSQQS